MRHGAVVGCKVKPHCNLVNMLLSKREWKNVIVKFLVHGIKKLITVGLTEGFGNGHCVRISGDIGENVCAHQSHRVWFRV